MRGRFYHTHNGSRERERNGHEMWLMIKLMKVKRLNLYKKMRIMKDTLSDLFTYLFDLQKKLFSTKTHL